MSAYGKGDLVDVVLKGCRVLPGAHGQREDWIALDDLAVDITGAEITVQPRWPAYGPPQVGEVWENAGGYRVFVHETGQQVAVRSMTGAVFTGVEHALAQLGPLHRVYPPPPVDEPAAAAADEAPPQLDERAALIAGIRELADLLEARPNLPANAYTVTSQVHVRNLPDVNTEDEAFAELRRIAAVLGVEPDLRDEPAARHPRATLRLSGGIQYEAVYVTDAYKRGYGPVDEPVLRDDQDEWADHDAAEHDAVRADVEAEGEAELAEERAAAMGGEPS